MNRCVVHETGGDVKSASAGRMSQKVSTQVSTKGSTEMTQKV
jgi:hypothetical protein